MPRREAFKSPLASVLLAATLMALPVTAAQETQPETASRTLRIGVVLDTTGPAAALGEGESKSLDLLKGQLRTASEPSGFSTEFVVLDSASSPTLAVNAVDRLLSGQEGEIHALICCTLSASTLLIISPVQAAGVPTISLAAAAPIARPAAQRRWLFQAAQSDALMARGLVSDLKRKGVSDITLLTLSDAYGESGAIELTQALEPSGVSVGAVVRYDRDASSLTAPALAASLNRPQAIIVWGIAEDSARMVRALRDLGYGGLIYLSHGVGAPAFLELAGSAAEGVRLPAGPALVADQLASNHPARAAGMAYREAYSAAYPGESPSTFGAHLHDAVKLLELAAQRAGEAGELDLNDLGAARAALRSALEKIGPYAGSTGVFDYTSSDHAGLDERAMVMVEVIDGEWRLAH